VLIAVAVVGATILLMLLWLAVALVFRWRFQFSIRSLLVLTVAVALPCSWLAVEMKAAREQSAAAQEFRTLNGWATYEYQWVDPRTVAVPRGPAWLRNLLGDDLFNNVFGLLGFRWAGVTCRGRRSGSRLRF